MHIYSQTYAEVWNEVFSSRSFNFENLKSTVGFTINNYFTVDLLANTYQMAVQILQRIGVGFYMVLSKLIFFRMTWNTPLLNTLIWNLHLSLTVITMQLLPVYW